MSNAQENLTLEQRYAKLQRQYNDLNERYLELTTPPTEQEVCEALSDFYNTVNKTTIYDFKFEKGDFISYGKMEMGGRYFLSIAEQPLSSISPHLITMIGRFYEKESEKDV
jgi:hypothetical protein